MATFDYTRLKSTAERLIARFGKSAVLRKKTLTGDEAAPTVSTTSTTVTLVDLDQMVRDKENSLVGVRQRRVYVSTAAGVSVEKDDEIQIGSVWHEVDESMPLNPGGTVLLYQAVLKT